MALNPQTSRIGIPVNLPTGATYELLLISTSGGFPVGQVSFQLEDTPRKITGIQKVAQFFMKVLFTQKGTDLLYPNLGTGFPELTIGANRTRDDSGFLLDVSSCVKDAENQTRNLLGGINQDPSSQLDKIVINGLTSDRDSLQMYLQLVTKSGETASVAVPFPQLDLKLSQ